MNGLLNLKTLQTSQNYRLQVFYIPFSVFPSMWDHFSVTHQHQVPVARPAIPCLRDDLWHSQRKHLSEYQSRRLLCQLRSNG
uniref:Uncharacterized protein n=1 Tax=Rhizophora mucronata TaxID=61149 RepID=A0A2P2QLG0_RHIMU